MRRRAILTLFPHSLPKRVSSELARGVDAVVRRDYPDFVAACRETKDGLVIDAMTVRRALNKLREANS